ncbi:MAG TPA: hypothetical protein VN893_20535 [Bryobacteraceae bacterium]|nr:hypothetical protein [Bryobacteraceae bacterium]
MPTTALTRARASRRWSCIKAAGSTSANIAGFFSNFVSTGATKSGITALSIPIYDVAEVVLKDGGLTIAVNVSMLTDQLGFGYAEWFVALMGVTPIADLIFAQIQLMDPSALNSFERGMDKAFGANDPQTGPSQTGPSQWQLQGPL